jgi:hypothetical protein
MALVPPGVASAEVTLSRAQASTCQKRLGTETVTGWTAARSGCSPLEAKAFVSTVTKGGCVVLSSYRTLSWVFLILARRQCLIPAGGCRSRTGSRREAPRITEPIRRALNQARACLRSIPKRTSFRALLPWNTTGTHAPCECRTSRPAYVFHTLGGSFASEPATEPTSIPSPLPSRRIRTCPVQPLAAPRSISASTNL